MEKTYQLPDIQRDYSDQELKQLANNVVESELKNEIKNEFKLVFQLRGDNYASYSYSGNQWTRVDYIKPREQTGEVIIQNISVVPKKILINALKEHLGKFKFKDGLEGKESIALTAFRRGLDLHYDVYRITDGVGSSIRSYDDNLGCSGKYSGSSDRDEGNNLLLRSLTREQLPFHGFKISHLLIKEAINSLSSTYYIHLHLWYFPEKVLPEKIKKSDRNNYYKYRDYKQSKDNARYLRSWKMLHKSLEALVLRIIDIQHD